MIFSATLASPLPTSLKGDARFTTMQRPRSQLSASRTVINRGGVVDAAKSASQVVMGQVGQAFTPRMVAGLEARIAEVTSELLDATDGSERLDSAGASEAAKLRASRRAATAC